VRELKLAVVVVVIAFLSGSQIALADGHDRSLWDGPLIELDPGNETEDPGLTISAIELGLSGGEAAPTSTRPRDCVVRDWGVAGVSTNLRIDDDLARVDQMEAGNVYYVECRWLDTGETYYGEVFTYQPDLAGPDLEAVARRVSDDVPLVFPAPATSPAIGADQITGLPTWLWIDPSGFQTFRAEATLAGITVTVTATPKHVTWNLGDGSEPVVCTGPGTPYDPTVADHAQATDCSHVFQFASRGRPDGVYHATATTTWALAWSAGRWGGGDLPDVTRSTTFDLTVTELQAVVTYGG
jgi:hypothetical protein